MKTVDDEMTELVKFQMSNGMFEISPDMWNDSVFNTYVGSLEQVKLYCPKGTNFNMWFTALAMKIMELKMSEQMDLWELIAEKSKKYLLSQIDNNEYEYSTLQEAARQCVAKIEK